MTDTDEDERVVEFDLPLSGGPDVDLFESHHWLWQKLDLDHRDLLLKEIFFMVIALCDPMTQPGESEFQLSVVGLADAATALGYKILLQQRLQRTKEDVAEETMENRWIRQQRQLVGLDFPLELPMLRFTLSLKFFEVLQALNKLLRADDEVRLRYLDNHRKFWDQTAQFWLPVLDRDDDEQQLKLLYYMCCTLIMLMFRMFGTGLEKCKLDKSLNTGDSANPRGNLAMNPYTDYFLRLWKTHSSIVSFALDIDRELEEEAWTNKGEYFDTPDNVKRALMGSSAVRIVLAAGLDNMFRWNLDKITEVHPLPGDLYHDLAEISILDFFDPLSRTAAHPGALGTRMGHMAVAMLVLRLYTEFLPCQSSKLDLELPLGANTAIYPSTDSDELERDLLVRTDPAGMSVDLLFDLFYEDNLDDDVKYVFGHYDSEDESEEQNDLKFPVNEELIEFDEQGRDWRDKVRGDNINLTPEFEGLVMDFWEKKPTASDHFFCHLREICEALRLFTLLEIEYMPKFLEHVGQSLVNTIALCTQDGPEVEDSFIGDVHQYLVERAPPEVAEEALRLRPHLLQSRPLTGFELILAFNPKTACAIMDELFMNDGLRRLLIWFMCHHLNLLMALINYLYELVAGLRGDLDGREQAYKFSRIGPLELSSVEKLMILHELFINSVSWLVSEDEDGQPGVPSQRAEKIVTCLCVMIEKLMNEGIIKISPDNSDEYEDYSQDIQGLLFLWIGRVPEARALYFKVRHIMFGESENQDPENAPMPELKHTCQTEKPHKKPENEHNQEDHFSTKFVLKPHPQDHRCIDEVSLLVNLASAYGKSVTEKCEEDSSPHDDFNKIVASFPNTCINTERLMKFVNMFIIDPNYVKLKNIKEKARLLSAALKNGTENGSANGSGTGKEPENEKVLQNQIAESEFNDDFLNGEGHFEKSDKKKKKKKTKKKKK